MGKLVRASIAIGLLLAAWLGLPAIVDVPPGVVRAAVAPGDCPTAEPPAADFAPGPGSTAPTVAARVGIGGLPQDVVVDVTDTRGRVFVADAANDVVAVLDGRTRDPAAIEVVMRVAVGGAPIGLALDPGNGNLLVANNGACSVSLISARADTPVVTQTIELSDHPIRVAVDARTHRAFVTLPGSDKVAVLDLESGTYVVRGEVDVAGVPNFLLVDARGRVVIGAAGGTGTIDSGLGQIVVLDGRAQPLPRVLSSGFSVSAPTGMAADPIAGLIYVSENGEDRVATLRVADDGTVTRVATVDADPSIDPGRNRNPVDVVLLPRRRELIVTLYEGTAGNQTRLNVFDVAESGELTFNRSLAGVDRATSVALDPVTGRVFVTERNAGRLTVIDAEVSAPLALPFVLPGPQNISLAPEDVARSFGLTLLVMLLIGAPTPLFNQTLEENLDEIRRMLRLDRLPKRRIRTRFGGPWLAVGIYVIAAAAIYAFLDLSFPGPDAAVIFASGLVGIVVGTATSVLPSNSYVSRRYKQGGSVRVAAWTLAIAGTCVILTRLTGTQPGYVYGIIGTFAFTMALSQEDEGRMAFLGGLALLGVAIGAWLLRIPVQPPAGTLPTGTALWLDRVLVAIFVTSIEGLVFGLIPLKFLAGAKIRAWSRPRWLALWFAGIVLFAHVILYPVSDYQPNPSAVGIVTVGATVAIYGAIAIGFWWFFRRRAQQRERAKAVAPAA